MQTEQHVALSRPERIKVLCKWVKMPDGLKVTFAAQQVHTGKLGQLSLRSHCLPTYPCGSPMPRGYAAVFPPSASRVGSSSYNFSCMRSSAVCHGCCRLASCEALFLWQHVQQAARQRQWFRWDPPSRKPHCSYHKEVGVIFQVRFT